MVEKLIRPHLFDLPGKIYSPRQCQALLDGLMREVEWQREYFSFGRRFEVPRLQAWYADEGVHYRYSDNMLQSRVWIPSLLPIKQTVENQSGHLFNSVLVTYYRDGHDHLTWHADDEPELGDAPVIASLSFGVAREFCYRHKRGEEDGSRVLHDGELLIMRPEFQQDWEHCVPPQPEAAGPRINLTFRKVITPVEKINGVRHR
jgi:alkylated DNA repair dioxygenase AlkB